MESQKLWNTFKNFVYLFPCNLQPPLIRYLCQSFVIFVTQAPQNGTVVSFGSQEIFQ